VGKNHETRLQTVEVNFPREIVEYMRANH